MAKENKIPDRSSDLCQRAEEVPLKQPDELDKIPPADVQRIFHELKAHQIELEMQNDELRRTQQEIEATREKYFDLYDLAPVGYVTLNEKGLILEANLTAAALLGKERNKLLKQPLSSFIFREDQDTYYLHHKRLFETRQRQECGVRMLKGDGAILWTRVDSTAAKGNDGLPESRTAIIDITRAKMAEEALAKACDELERQSEKKAEESIKRCSRELERSNRELDNFASLAVHDLGAPLRVVSGFANRLQKRYKEKLDAEADRYISHIVEGAKRMHHLVNDLLEYTRVGTRRKPLVPVDVNAIIERTLANLRYEITERRAVITVDPLPSVSADRTQLIQLFQNLVGNAIKYSTNTPSIHISAELKNRDWLFRVSDNGIGIDPRQFDRIFQIFQRLHASDEYSGTGIGLAICKKIVEMLGGRIWVESKPGEGSTFFFTLPVTES